MNIWIYHSNKASKENELSFPKAHVSSAMKTLTQNRIEHEEKKSCFEISSYLLQRILYRKKSSSKIKHASVFL